MKSLGTSARPLSILVVEDEEDIRFMLSQFISRDGHTAVTAKDGREGFDLFRSRA